MKARRLLELASHTSDASAGRPPRMASSQCEESDENHGPHLRSSRNLLSVLQGGCGPDAGAAGSLGAAVASLRAAAAEPVDARDCTSGEDAGAPGARGQSRLIVRTDTGIAARRTTQPLTRRRQRRRPGARGRPCAPADITNAVNARSRDPAESARNHAGTLSGCRFTYFAQPAASPVATANGSNASTPEAGGLPVLGQRLQVFAGIRANPQPGADPRSIAESWPRRRSSPTWQSPPTQRESTSTTRHTG